MFMRLYGISYSQFRRLKEHYEKHGICPRQHGNTKRLPENTLSQSTVEDLHSFLANYVEENAIMLPGRIPEYKSDDIKILSSSETKISVWRVYRSASSVVGGVLSQHSRCQANDGPLHDLSTEHKQTSTGCQSF